MAGGNPMKGGEEMKTIEVRLFLDGELCLKTESYSDTKKNSTYWFGSGWSNKGHMLGPAFLGYDTLEKQVEKMHAYATSRGYDGTNSKVEVAI